MHVYLIALSFKNFYQAYCFCCVPIQVSQGGFMLRLVCVFLGCDLPIQLLLKSLASAYHDRLVNHFHHALIYFMNYEIPYMRKFLRDKILANGLIRTNWQVKYWRMSCMYSYNWVQKKYLEGKKLANGITFAKFTIFSHSKNFPCMVCT